MRKCKFAKKLLIWLMAISMMTNSISTTAFAACDGNGHHQDKQCDQDDQDVQDVQDDQDDQDVQDVQDVQDDQDDQDVQDVQDDQDDQDVQDVQDDQDDQDVQDVQDVQDDQDVQDILVDPAVYTVTFVYADGHKEKLTINASDKIHNNQAPESNNKWFDVNDSDKTEFDVSNFKNMPVNNNMTFQEVAARYTVTFLNVDLKEIDHFSVASGNKLNNKDMPHINSTNKWSVGGQDYSAEELKGLTVEGPMTITEVQETQTYTVTFLDADLNEIDTFDVKKGDKLDDEKMPHFTLKNEWVDKDENVYTARKLKNVVVNADMTFTLVKAEETNINKDGIFEITKNENEGNVTAVKAADWIPNSTTEAEITFTLDGVPVTTESAVDVIVVLDKSLSMNRYNNGTTFSTWVLAKAAVDKLTRSILVNQGNNVAIVLFSKEISGNDFTNNPTDISTAMDTGTSGGTRYDLALIKATEYAAKSKNPLHIVFVSDGKPTGKDNGSSYAQSLKDNGAIIHTIGIGVEEDGAALLNTMKSEGGFFQNLSDVNQLEPMFEKIYKKVNEVPATTDAVLTDVLSEQFELADGDETVIRLEDGTALESTFTHNDDGTTTIEIKVNSIQGTKKIIIPIKLKEEFIYEDGKYPTNKSAELTYTDLNGESKLISSKEDPESTIKSPELSVKAKTFTVTYNGNGESTTVDVDYKKDEEHTISAGTIFNAPEGKRFASWKDENGKTYVAGDKLIVTEDVILYAQWSDIPTYTVQWINENGTELEVDENVLEGTIPVYNGNKPEKVATAQYTFEFNDWTPEIVPATENAVYTATYKSTTNKYSVTFKDGEDILSTVTVDYGTSWDKVTKPNTDKEGYRFETWNNVPDDGIVKNNVEVTADYDLINYNIKYDLKGGNASDRVTSYNIETPTFTLVTPKKTGHTFMGWKENDGDTVLSVEIVEGSTGHREFEAVWKCKEYTVKFQDEDETPISEETLKYGEEIKAPAEEPTKESTDKFTYTFAGWVQNNGPEFVEGTTVKEAVIYTASYKETINKYKIKFVDEEGTGILQDTDQEYDAVITTPENPTKPETDEFTYEFDEWVLVNDETEVLKKGETTVSGEAVYKPTFSATTKQYTVTFDCDNGAEPEKVTVNYGTLGDNVTNPFIGSDPEKNGYTFTGWEVLPDKIEKDVTVKATYTLNQYTITYNLDDGELNPCIVTYTVENENFLIGQPDKVGFNFKGWTEDDKEGNSTLDVSIVTELACDRSFTAHWEENPEERLAATIVPYEGTYDGAKYDAITSVSVLDETGDTVEGATITYSFNEKIKDAGTYPVVVRIEKDGFISYEEEVIAIIEKAEVTINVDDKTKTVGTADPSFTATVGGLIGEDTIAYKLSRENTSEAIGTYVIGATFDEHKNYAVSVNEGTLTIKAAPAPVNPTTPTPTPTTPVTPVTTPVTEVIPQQLVPTAPIPTQVLPAPVAIPEPVVTPVEEQQVVEIEEDIVPQAQTVEETVTIDEDNVPLAVEPTSKHVWALFNLLLAIITVATSVVLLMGYFMNKKKDDDLEEEGESNNNKKGMIRALSVIPAVAAVVVFILTENMLNSMVLVDKWTLAMVAIALAQVVVAFASRKKSDDEDDTEAFAQ